MKRHRRSLNKKNQHCKNDFPTFFHKFNAIPIKIPIGIWTRTRQADSSVICKDKQTRRTMKTQGENR